MKSDDEILKEAAERSELLDIAGFDYLGFVKQTNEAYNRLFCTQVLTDKTTGKEI